MTSLTIKVSSWPTTASPDQVDIVVSVGVKGGLVTACWAGSLVHHERDYLNTLVEEATMSWMYGETRRNIARSCASVKKLARRHEHATSP